MVSIMADKKFIKTKDQNTKNTLVDIGYTLFSNNNGEYIFLNNGKVTFDKKNIKAVYTNILNI